MGLLQTTDHIVVSFYLFIFTEKQWRGGKPRHKNTGVSVFCAHKTFSKWHACTITHFILVYSSAGTARRSVWLRDSYMWSVSTSHLAQWQRPAQRERVWSQDPELQILQSFLQLQRYQGACHFYGPRQLRSVSFPRTGYIWRTWCNFNILLNLTWLSSRTPTGSWWDLHEIPHAVQRLRKEKDPTRKGL